MSTASKIAQAAHRLESEQQAYLQNTGWTYVCDTPGSYWLWSKTFANGRTLLVNIDMAVTMQANIDAYPDPKWEAPR